MLSIHGAVADLDREQSKDSRALGKPDALEYLKMMEISTEPSIDDPHTDEKRQGNLVQDYERKFEQLSDNQKLSKLCSDAGLKIVEKGQYFFTLDTEEGLNEMEHLCREKTLPRNEKKTRAKGWILKNTRIGPVLDIQVCFHQDRCSIEILVESLFPDRTASWVRIVNGIEKVRDRIDRNH